MALKESYWAADRSEPVLELTVGGMLRSAAAAAPERTALVAGMPEPADRRRWTYAELLHDAEQLALVLAARFAPGEHVTVWAPNLPEWVLMEMATGLAGIVLVTANPAFRARELAYVLRQSRSVALFAVREFRGNPMAQWVEEVRGELTDLREVVWFEEWDAFIAHPKAEELPLVGPDAVAQLQYTSGTTGFPKGAYLTHRGITNNARFYAELFEVGEDDVWVSPMPLFHTGGCVLGVLGSLWAHLTFVCVLAFDPQLVLELIEEEGATALTAVPTMLIALLEQLDATGADTPHLRSVMSGGSTVPAELVRRVEERMGVRFAIVFGQTEASPVMTQTRLDDTIEHKAETIGQPHPQQELAILDPETRQVVPIGVTGEICGRGYQVMLGYFDMPEATAEAIDEEGWLHTGDLGTMDADGYVRIAGRIKDMIIRGGENISPREIEDVLLTFPAVADVAVVAVPDERYGEEVAAVIRVLPGARAPSAEELRAYVRARLAAHKTPRRWAFVDEFPLTPSGKIQKYILREQLATGAL
jgi:fatty-acyl-CoA synthase